MNSSFKEGESDQSSSESQYEAMNNGPHERPFVQIVAPAMAYHMAFWLNDDSHRPPKSDYNKSFTYPNNAGSKKNRQNITQDEYSYLKKNIEDVHGYFDFIKNIS